MTATLVDTNVLIDIFHSEAAHRSASGRAIADLAEVGDLVVNPIIWSELSAAFASLAALETSLSGLGLVREHLPWDAAFEAGQAHAAYRRAGGERARTLPERLVSSGRKRVKRLRRWWQG